MASYRYERDIDPKDLQPRKQRQYTRKERWANWWDYNLKWVIIIGIIVVFFGYNFIGQYFFTVHADYNVAVVAPHYLPEATQTALQDACVDSITVFSKCHHGWSYHPTTVGATHPGLGFDLLKAQIEACHEVGIRTPVYLSAGLDERQVVQRGEWVWMCLV